MLRNSELFIFGFNSYLILCVTQSINSSNVYSIQQLKIHFTSEMKLLLVLEFYRLFKNCFKDIFNEILIDTSKFLKSSSGKSKSLISFRRIIYQFS